MIPYISAFSDQQKSAPVAPLWSMLSILLGILLIIGFFIPVTFSWIPVAALFLLLGFMKKLQQRKDDSLYATTHPASFKFLQMKGIIIWIGLLITLTFSSSIWSISSAESLERAVKVIGLVIPCCFLIYLVHRMPLTAFSILQRILPYFVLIGLIGITAEYWLDFPVSRLMDRADCNEVCYGSSINKNISALVLFLPLALYSLRYYPSRTAASCCCIVMIILTLACLYKTQSQASVIAFIIMAAAWISMAIPNRFIIKLYVYFLSFLSLFFPWLAAIAFDFVTNGGGLAGHDSIQRFMEKGAAGMRLEIWDFIARKIISNPWTGFGMDATRYIQDFQTQQLFFNSAVVMHPHNIALQIWIEFGLAGILLFVGLLFYICKEICAMAPVGRRLYFTLLCGIMTVLFLSWSLWSSWLLGLLFILWFWLKIVAQETNNGLMTS